MPLNRSSVVPPPAVAAGTRTRPAPPVPSLMQRRPLPPERPRRRRATTAQPQPTTRTTQTTLRFVDRNVQLLRLLAPKRRARAAGHPQRPKAIRRPVNQASTRLKRAQRRSDRSHPLRVHPAAASPSTPSERPNHRPDVREWQPNTTLPDTRNRIRSSSSAGPHSAGPHSAGAEPDPADGDRQPRRASPALGRWIATRRNPAVGRSGRHAGLRRRSAPRHLRHDRPTAVARAKSTPRHLRATSRCHRARPRLHRLRHGSRMVPSAPHQLVVPGRKNRPRQPLPPVLQAPPPGPRTRPHDLDNPRRIQGPTKVDPASTNPTQPFGRTGRCGSAQPVGWRPASNPVASDPGQTLTSKRCPTAWQAARCRLIVCTTVASPVIASHQRRTLRSLGDDEVIPTPGCISPEWHAAPAGRDGAPVGTPNRRARCTGRRVGRVYATLG
jgi:hypothetical protein